MGVLTHGEQEEPILVGVWSEDLPETAQGAPPAEEEQRQIPWWFVGLVALLLWGPLAGAVVRPYRRPD